jgi:hypothetical protein
MLIAALLVGACSDAESTNSADATSANAQTPPTDAAAVESWLRAGSYKSWQCEPEVHASRAPSPHGFNRICSNDVISAHAEGSEDWPKGAAGVKELYASADDKSPMGYSVYLKTGADSAGGAGWYWYERIGENVVADGMGDSGKAKSICVGCHMAAGSDPGHTPTAGGRDQVYTAVP